MIKNVQITDTTPMCGIYLITFPNGKVYVGQSQKIHYRILEHNSRARNNHTGNEGQISLCDAKIRQYFPKGVQSYDVLELCSIDELDDKEKYWIEFYDALNKNKGYNFLDRGNVSGRRGTDHINAAFNEEQLDKITKLLLYHKEYSLIDIANMFNVSQQTIFRINQGSSYYRDDLIYPLRFNDHTSQRKSFNDYFSSEEELLSLKEDLKYSWWLTIENDLSIKYNIPLKILREINNGTKFSEIGNYTYPIRGKNIRNKNNLKQEDILEILDILRNTNQSMTEIGKKYNFDRNAISKINKGEGYIIKNYDYPARKTNK